MIVSSVWLDVENAWSTSLVVNICFIAGLILLYVMSMFSQFICTMNVTCERRKIALKQLILKDFIIQWKFLIWYILYPVFFYMALTDTENLFIIMSVIITIGATVKHLKQIVK